MPLTVNLSYYVIPVVTTRLLMLLRLFYNRGEVALKHNNRISSSSKQTYWSAPISKNTSFWSSQFVTVCESDNSNVFNFCDPI